MTHHSTSDRSIARASRVAVLVLSLLLGVGCHHNFEKDSGPAQRNDRAVTENRHPVVAPQNVILKLSGSTTVGEPIKGETNGVAGELAAEYLKKLGARDTAFQSQLEQSDGSRITRTYAIGTFPDGTVKTIEIEASGSGKAFRDLRNPQSGVDIGMSSRAPLPAEEKEVKAEVIALDAVAIIANAGNPLKAITRAQLREIFTRRVRNWSEIAGAGTGPISVYSRPFPDPPPADPNKTHDGSSVSGTYEVFHDKVLKPLMMNRDPEVMERESSAELVEEVGKNNGAIGFVGRAFASRDSKNIRVLAVSDEGLEPVLPDECSIAQERYILNRRLFLMTRSSGAKEIALDFIRFVTSDYGQEIIPKTKVVKKTVNQFCADGPVLVQFSTSLHFARGDGRLDSKARQDLAEILRRSGKGEQFVVLGHADGIGGTPAQNVALSKQRAEAVANELRANDLKVIAVEGLGSQYPVQSDSMEGGPDANRRVEVLIRRVPR